MELTAEATRLQECRDRTKHWKRWGPYVSERAWGTVREDYSTGGDAWGYFPHDHARSRAYRWNEDGLAGISDRHQRICFALALWNRRDPFLKERLFGLTGGEGNHGEDVKEYYFYLDSTPTHSYMKYLYKYPHAAFPYQQLVDENRNRGKHTGEYELIDTGVFADNRYFDVVVEYAKATPEDVLIRISITNRGPETASLDLLPTIWFRNTWSWDSGVPRPRLHRVQDSTSIALEEPKYGSRWLHADAATMEPRLLFTENDTNTARVFDFDNGARFTKDSFHRFIVDGDASAVNPEETGTKAAAAYGLTVGSGETRSIRLRLTDEPAHAATFGPSFDGLFATRMREANAFYDTIVPASLSADQRNVARQAFAGLLWSKQYYHYVVKPWLDGDRDQPPPPDDRRRGRNHEWTHLYNADVISMPDKWEYPWYAAWDLAFHALPLALVDADFAKEQLLLLLREWYMHPNGQLPAYEWSFGDVNPPVHAWAAWRVYKIEKKRRGHGDLAFLEKIFHKLLLNFTWWVNRKDAEGMNVFQGGFLGLDNIGVFDRSAPLPTGGHLEQSDGTSWMAMYSLNMLAIALELAAHNHAYEDVASKFWEHFLNIAHAMAGGRSHGGHATDLWDDEDGFFYDVLHRGDERQPLKIRSLVGLIPLLAVQTLEPLALGRHHGFRRRLEWFVEHRSDLIEGVACMRQAGQLERRLLSILDGDQLRRVLTIMLDEREFLSPHGIRSVSRIHRDRPYVLSVSGMEYRVDYEPAESTTSLFGGNSNWRGPVWFPINFLIVEALQKFHHYFGDQYKVECPTGSGQMMNLWEVSEEISRRLTSIFLRNSEGHRPVFGDVERFQNDPHWNDLISFHEYFNGDTGAGIGASHQTGWTALVAKLLQQSGADDESDRSTARTTQQRAPRGARETIGV